MSKVPSIAERERSTKRAYLLTRILDTPFWGLYNLLPFILYRDLGATPFQIAMLVTLKPLSSFFSSLWGGFVYNRPDRLVANIVTARLLATLPYLLFPWIESPWIFIFAHGFYMMLSVGTTPAWMEVLKQNLPEKGRSRLFSYCQAFGYLGGGLFPLIIGYLLDGFHESWRWLFPLFAAVTWIPLFFQGKMTVEIKDVKMQKNHLHFLKLIKDSLSLLKERGDFFSFQLAFMALGSALMILQPALPSYFVDVLKLTYMELSLAITLSKGVGYVVASPLLPRLFSSQVVFGFSLQVALVTAVFPLLLLLCRIDFHLIYLAYLVYGVAQAGSEFLWNMSGPIFSKERDSSLYSTINIIMVGMRGAVVPALGSLLLVFVAPSWVMAVSALISLTGAFFLWSGAQAFWADRPQKEL